jgi:amino-acid N-acetyltransferase
MHPDIPEENLPGIAEDLLILHLLQVGIVIVVGGKPEGDTPISPEEFREIERRELLRFQNFLNLLGKSWALIPERLFRPKIRTGNYILSRLIGVKRGVSYGKRGVVHFIDRERVLSPLKENEMVLLSGLLPSYGGELLWVSPLELSLKVAIEISAEKWIWVLPELPPLSATELHPSELPKDPFWDPVRGGVKGGIAKIHLVKGEEGEILKELFTSEGSGILITTHPSKEISIPKEEEIGEILALLSFFQSQEIVIPRTEENLRENQKEYRILKMDGKIIGCGAIKLFPETRSAYIHSLVVHPSYQKRGIGSAILLGLEREAFRKGARTVFLSTTQTMDWFVSKGYELVEKGSVPAEIKKVLPPQRNSLFLKKALTRIPSTRESPPSSRRELKT